MFFYTEWKNEKQSNKPDNKFIADFITLEPRSLESLYTENEAELDAAYFILHKTALGAFLQEIKSLQKLPILKAQDVPCFSNLENGASRLNELLLFTPDGLTFSELGYQLINSTNDVAQKKYGENQSKLAAIMDLVILSNTRPIVVKPTAWGNYLARYSFDEKKDVLKKLLLRDKCIQKILCQAFHGIVSYRRIVSFLSDSTKIRRRTSIRCLLNFILKDSEYEIILSNIDWEV